MIRELLRLMLETVRRRWAERRAPDVGCGEKLIDAIQREWSS